MKFGKRVDYTLEFDGGAKRRRRLLAEFLQERFARRQLNAEEESSRDLETESQNEVTLSDDLLFRILILLPAESLFMLQIVCKKWFSLINSSAFIRCHAQQSETVLICKKLTLLEPGNSAASQPVRPHGFEEKLKSYFHFMDLDDGDDKFIESSIAELVDIRASCDGLILVTVANNKSLMLMNPVTSKHIVLPLGKNDSLRAQSFSIAFCNEANTYKVVHLFRDKSHCTGCEVLNVCSKKWTRIEGPPSEIVICAGQIPVSVGGSLHWMSKKVGSDYIISMSLQDEKFASKSLPVSSAAKDRLVEIGGNLGFVTRAQFGVLQVWILMTDDGSRENWMNRHNVNLNVDVAYPVPVCSSRKGKGLVLGTIDGELYDYDFERGEMKLVQSTYDDEARFERIDGHYIPHRNTLVSWEDHLDFLC